MTDSGFPRLLDPDALDAANSPRARIEIVVLELWLRAGARIEIELPPRLRCDLCDGGGCDGCGRSGAYRTSGSASALQLTLPCVTDDHLLLRILHPLGDAPTSVLLVQLSTGFTASPGVRAIAPSPLSANAAPPPPSAPVSYLHHFARVVFGPARPDLQRLRSAQQPGWAASVAVALLAAVAALLMHWLFWS